MRNGLVALSCGIYVEEIKEKEQHRRDKIDFGISLFQLDNQLGFFSLHSASSFGMRSFNEPEASL